MFLELKLMSEYNYMSEIKKDVLISHKNKAYLQRTTLYKVRKLPKVTKVVEYLALK